MSRIAIFYATRDGHTRRIADVLAADLRHYGFQVDLQDVAWSHAAEALEGCAGALVAASVHGGRHEAEIVRFARDNRERLERVTAAFVSVSLSEASVEDPQRPAAERDKAAADVAQLVDDFFAETGWRPARVRPVAGALVYTKYNPIVRFVMRRIAASHGASTDTSRDHDLTDWVALDRFAADFATDVARASLAGIEPEPADTQFFG